MNKNVLGKNKKYIVGLVLIIVLIILLFTLLIGASKNKSTDKKSGTIEMGEFEKIAVFNYIEKEYLGDEALSILTQNSGIDEKNGKYIYAITKAFANDNRDTVIPETVANEYKKIFDEEIDLEKRNEILTNLGINTKNAYSYDEQERVIHKNFELERHEINRLYEIQDIYKEEETYVVKINIKKYNNEMIRNYITSIEYRENDKGVQKDYLYDKIMRIDSLDYTQRKELYSTVVTKENESQLTENVGTAKLYLKIVDGRYVIGNYEEFTNITE